MLYIRTKLNVTVVFKLMLFLLKGLQDESSVCVRHSLSSMHSCLNPLLVSCDHKSAVLVFPFLIRTASNPYWLVKVKQHTDLSKLCTCFVK